MQQSNSLLRRSISIVLFGIVLTFVITTSGNVSEFVHQYHSGFTGYTLGLCFGVTLFLSSYIYSIAKSKKTKYTALTVALAFGFTSAGFQTALYMNGDAPWYVAVALSFTPILFGEVGLAVLESNYSEEADTERSAVDTEALETQIRMLQNQAETHQLSLEAIKNERDEFETQLREFENMETTINPLSLLDQMSEKYKSGLTTLIETVAAGEVKSASDFQKASGLAKSFSYELFNMAKEIGIIQIDTESDKYLVIGELENV